MGVVTQAIQVGTSSFTVAENWVSVDVAATWVLATTFVSDFWVYFLVIFVLGLLYYAYIFSQRRGQSAYG
jgi:hypothetical protein